MAKQITKSETAVDSDPRLSMFTRKPYQVDIEGTEPMFLKRFSGADRLSFIEKVKEMDSARIMVLIVAYTSCTAEGVRIFRDDEVDVVAKIDADIIDRLGNEALKLNGLGQGAAEAATKSAE